MYLKFKDPRPHYVITLNEPPQVASRHLRKKYSERTAAGGDFSFEEYRELVTDHDNNNGLCTLDVDVCVLDFGVEAAILDSI